MSANPPRSPKQYLFTRAGFQPLTEPQTTHLPSNDATIDIPLEHYSSHGQSGQGRIDTMYSTNDDQHGGDPEKNGLLQRRGGKRKIYKINSKGKPLGRTGYDGEEDTINKMGLLYQKVLNFSIVTRYFVYVLPLAIVIAIPIIIGATVAKNAEVGGVRMLWLFTWIMIVWLSLWVSKIVARWLPYIFQFLAGIVSSGTRKYALVIKALEIPLSLAGWALTSLATFIPVCSLSKSFFCFELTKTDNDSEPSRPGICYVTPRCSNYQALARHRQQNPCRSPHFVTNLPRREVHRSAYIHQLPSQAIQCEDKGVETQRSATEPSV